MDKIGVIILHYKGEKDTRECLDSFRLHSYADLSLKLIVVANQSDKSFSSALKKDYPHIELIENKFNFGFAKGNNIGIERALSLGCDYIILINNDTISSKDLIPRLVLFAKKDPKVGLVSPKIFFAAGFEYHHNRYKANEQGKVLWYAGGRIDWANVYAFNIGIDEVDQEQFNKSNDTDFATGCCMLIKRSVVDKIGLFDKKYFLYYEDVDYSVRAKKSGFEVKYCSEAILWHKNAASSGRPGSKLHIYYQTRNRLYFGYKYSSLWTKKSLLVESIKMFTKGGIYSKSVSDYYLGRMGETTL